MSAISDVRKNRTAGDIAFATGSDTASYDLVAAVTSRKIRVLSLIISAAATQQVKFQSGASTDLTKLFYLTTADLYAVLPFNPFGWFDTVAGEKLNVVLAQSQATHCTITYIKI